MVIESLTEIVLATGAVGTAAMGIVEGAKSTWFKPIGFSKLLEEIKWAERALEKSYGKNYEDMLSSLFRSNRGSSQLPRILRQGVRVGLTEETAKQIAKDLSISNPDELSDVAKQVTSGTDISNKTKERNILGRFEMLADARIDSALAMADRAYKNGLRWRASFVAFILSITAAYIMYEAKNGFFSSDLFTLSLIVGVTAVPIAPIAKDVAKGLQAAAKAIGTRK